MTLALSGWRKLAPLRKQVEVVKAFLFLPILVEDEAVALHITATLKEAWRAKAWVWREIPWPSERLDLAAPEVFRSQWLRAFDNTIQNAQPDDTIVLNFSSTAHGDAAKELIPWINLRREPMRVAKVRCLMYWLDDLKTVLMLGAPDLWSMRAMNPQVLKIDIEAAREAIPVNIKSVVADAPMPVSSIVIPKLKATAANKHVSLYALFAEVDALLENSRVDEALAVAQRAQAQAEGLAKSGEPSALRDLSISYNKFGDVQRDLARPEAALQSYAAGLVLREALRGQLGETPQVLRDLSVSHENLGDAQLDLARLEAALQSYAAGLELSETLRKQLGDLPQVLRDLSVSHSKLGDVQLDLARPEAALQNYAASLVLREALRKQLGDTPQVLRDLSVSHSKLGDVHRDLARPEAALQSYAAGLVLSETSRKQLGDTPQVLRDLAISHERLGDVQRDLARGNEAAEHWREALNLYRIAIGGGGESLKLLVDMRAPLSRLAKHGDTAALATLATINAQLANAAPDHPEVAKWIAANRNQ